MPCPDQYPSNHLCCQRNNNDDDAYKIKNKTDCLL